jgi:hypothetical protein
MIINFFIYLLGREPTFICLKYYIKYKVYKLYIILYECECNFIFFFYIKVIIETINGILYVNL